MERAHVDATPSNRPRPQRLSSLYASTVNDHATVQTPVLLIARFRGDVGELTRSYDRAHALIMDAGGPPGELRHHCAIGEDSLYIVGLWESEEHLRTRFASSEMQGALEAAGFPPMSQSEQTILHIHAVEPPI